jgi:hypothetical protein
VLQFAELLWVVRFSNLVVEMLAGMGFGLYLFWKGFKLLQERRLILDTPNSTIRSAAMGLVEVSGLACGPSTISAPISRLACYYYATTVWQYKQSGRNWQWVQVARECSHLPFYLDDNTGRLLINPDGADMDIHCDFKEEYSDSVFSRFDALPEDVRSFLLSHDVSSNHRTRVEERCIKPKNALFVLGTLAENPERKTTAGLQENSGLPQGVNALAFSTAAGVGAVSSSVTLNGRVNLAKTTDPAIVTAAMMKAGITNPAAWQAAGISSAQAAAVNSTIVPTGDFDPNPATVVMKGAHNSTFLISWRSQREVVSSLGWKCSLMIWGGPALFLFCFYLLAAYFKWL